jgi:perosamine synthetase
MVLRSREPGGLQVGHLQPLSQITQLMTAVRSVIGTTPAVLHEPDFGGSEGRYVKECIESTFVSSVGRFVTDFEAALADYVGVRHSVAVVNGTAALQVALVMAGVEPGDEVIVPSLTFVGTANAVRHAGADPHFVDSEETSLGLDPDALRRHLSRISRLDGGALRNRQTDRRIAAVVPVHVFGHPADITGIDTVCSEFGIPVVEDAAQSLGSFYGSRHTGTTGVISAVSFNGNKIVTTGGGGALLTDDDDLAARAKHLTTTAKRAHPWRFDHDAVAWNYRMPNINAALGCAQMERLPQFVEAKRRLATRYADAVSAIPGVQFIWERHGTFSNYWLSAIRLIGADMAIRDEAISAFISAGIGVRPVWSLLHKLPMYANCSRAALPVAERLEQEIINLPSGFGLARGK